MAQYVKLGPKASFFRASSIDVSVAPGQVVALNAKQMNNRLITRAINGGHLVLTSKPGSQEEEKPKVITPEQLRDSFLEMVAAGDNVNKIAKTFSVDDLTKIAALYDIEVEEGDKKADICKAIFEEVSTPQE